MSVTHHQVEKVRKALPVFRATATAEGIALIVLVAEMVLKYGFDNGALNWWPAVHGIIYFVFVLGTANLGFAAKWSLAKMVLVMCSGLVPVLSFWAEHKVVAQVREQLDGWGAAQDLA